MSPAPLYHCHGNSYAPSPSTATRARYSWLLLISMFWTRSMLNWKDRWDWFDLFCFDFWFFLEWNISPIQHTCTIPTASWYNSIVLYCIVLCLFLPPSLPPSLPCIHIGTANECQFIFSVQEFYMIQKLRGTVTYMMKVQYGLCVCHHGHQKI